MILFNNSYRICCCFRKKNKQSKNTDLENTQTKIKKLSYTKNNNIFDCCLIFFK